TAGVQNPFLLVELPAAVLLGLQAALQLVGQAADRAAQRFQLLVEIGAQPFKLCRVGKVLGPDLLVESLGINLVVGASLTDRGRQLGRHLAVGLLGILDQFVVGLVVQADLGLAFLLGA